MQTGWVVLFIRSVDKEGKPQALPKFPLVGEKVVHFLGKSDDGEKQKKDKENPLWDKVQDGVRPAWAPDILRMGYCVVFKREDLPRLALKLGIKNPEKLKKENGGKPKATGGARVLTFDDVWAVAVEPERRPMLMPILTLNDEEWWLATGDAPKAGSAFMAPGGAVVRDGAHRMADIVSVMLSTPHGRPRPLPTETDPDDYSEFNNPLVPVDKEVTVQDHPDTPAGHGQSGPSDQYATTPLFRY